MYCIFNIINYISVAYRRSIAVRIIYEYVISVVECSARNGKGMCTFDCHNAIAWSYTRDACFAKTRHFQGAWICIRRRA